MNFDIFESEGAKTVLTLFLILWLSIIAVYMHATGHDPAETGRTLITNAFTALMTILVSRLSKKGS